jgi:hypothetical protein
MSDEPQDARVSAGSYPPGHAPRLTIEEINGVIEGETYANFGTLIICVLSLRNGTKITGESDCVYPENYDAERGRKIARDKAVAKLWSLEGYLLAQRRHENELRYAGN